MRKILLIVFDFFFSNLETVATATVNVAWRCVRGYSLDSQCLPLYSLPRLVCAPRFEQSNKPGGLLMNAGTVNNASSAVFKGNKADFECFAYRHHPTTTTKKRMGRWEKSRKRH